MKSSNLQKKIELAATSFGNRLFRNNVAKSWIGKSIRYESTRVITVNEGDVLVKNARRLHSGLCKGSADLIGFTSIEITPEMVGRKVAVFTAGELKTGSDKPSDEQKAFIKTVNKSGGIAGEIRSVNDYHNLIESFLLNPVDKPE